MTVKEYLMQVQTLEERIEDQKQYIETLRESLTSIGAMDLSMERVQTSTVDKDRFASVISKIIEAEGDLNLMEEKLCLLKVQIAEQIHGMEDLVLKKLLKHRYLDWKQFGTIPKLADVIGYSVDHTKTLHRKALYEFGEMLRQHNT